ncbi:MAG TPA: YjbH domain-containing protein [Aliidongia sp.]|uniref:YjbH domain-containing protein n=1 Tax=Aliidongia sp. TaxID=1914230 RepID=UPI002DDD8A4F|nr:YjbH domain-containing protein [Aliidongia sp.]HEV2674628.1 YjbH domain-containing protein [Aliidongia sp.]
MAFLCAAGAAHADGELSEILDPGQGLFPTQSDISGIGLFQVPSARMGEEGDVRASGSFITPYHRFVFSGTAFPWMEGVFRTTQITNVPFGPNGFGGHQSYRDRGFDLRFRLWQEGPIMPDLTLGVTDFAQFGSFDEEYLVGTKRYGDFDVTVGLGWGQLASDGQLPNPLKYLFGHFAKRHPINTAGGFRTDFFTGPDMSLFGGFEYKTPIDGLIFKLEFNPNDYRHDAFNEIEKIKPAGPIDAGFVYRPFASGPEVSLAMERENTMMLRVGFKTNLGKLTGAEAPKSQEARQIDPQRAPVGPLPLDEVADRDTVAAKAPLIGPAPTVLPRREPVPQPLPPESWNALADLGLTADRFGFRILSIGTTAGVRLVTLVRLSTARGDLSEDLGSFARMAGRLQPAVDRVELTLDEAGTERRLHFDLPTLERAVAMTGRTAESVRAQNPTPSVTAAPHRTIRELDRNIAHAIFSDLAAAKMIGYTFEIKGHEAILRLGNYRYRYTPKALGDAARIIDARAPAEVTEITIADVEAGVEVVRVRMRRDDLQRAFTGRGSAAEVLAHAELNGGEQLGDNAFANEDVFPDFSYRIRPRLKTQLNGPDGFFLYSLYMGLSSEVQLRPGLTIAGDFGVNMLDNFNRLQNPSNSLLPHVRSDIKDYLKDGKYGISSLYANYTTRLGGDFYGRLTGGLLEDMYAGVDGEVLYRPYGSRWAFGLELNQLYKRSFHEQFGLQSYNVATGQLGIYYDMPWYGLQSTLKVGRYLARDIGFTYEISRQFESGVRVGGFFTITNVPAAIYGEGRFDRGLFVSIPIDLVTPFPSRSTIGTAYRPLTRDGGQMLVSPKSLYWETRGQDPGHMSEDWDHFLQ